MLTAVWIQTRTLYLNSDDSQSKLPACIISVCLYSDRREAVFFTGSPELHFPLPIMFEWQDRMCYKQPVLGINLKKQPTATMKHQQQRRYLRNMKRGKQHSAQITLWYILQAGSMFYMLWLHSCQFFLISEHKAHENHWLVRHETG